MQIAEHNQFTAINALELNGAIANNAFVVNHNIAVFCKYASEPNGIGEYQFTFNKEHLDSIKKSKRKFKKQFLGLVCVEDGEICCLSRKQFNRLKQNRKISAKNKEEDQYVILVKIKPRASLRAYTNAAGKKGTIAGKMLTISRKAFPEKIFD